MVELVQSPGSPGWVLNDWTLPSKPGGRTTIPWRNPWLSSDWAVWLSAYQLTFTTPVACKSWTNAVEEVEFPPRGTAAKLNETVCEPPAAPKDVPNATVSMIGRRIIMKRNAGSLSILFQSFLASARARLILIFRHPP